MIMMGKELIDALCEYVDLYRDTETGIAWVENGYTGAGHSAHPSIHSSGSPSGMKKKGWWGSDDRLVRSHGFIYNIDILAVSDEYDELARKHCECGGNHG